MKLKWTHFVQLKLLFFALIFLWNDNSVNAQENCACAEYVYINEPTKGGQVRKFLVNEDGSLFEVNPQGPWYPNGNVSEMAKPHGLGTDLNGYLYIGENWNCGEGACGIRKLDCDGNILPTTDFYIPEIGPFNLFSSGNIVFSNSSGTGTYDGDNIHAFNLCTGDYIGAVCFAPDANGNGVNAAWSFYRDHLTDTYYVYGGDGEGCIYQFDPEDPTLFTDCVQPKFCGTTGNPIDNGLSPYGITVAPNEDVYMVVSQGFGGAAQILHYSSTGTLLNQTTLDTVDGDGGWYGTVSLTYSETCNCIYSSTFSSVEDCVYSWNLDLSERGTAVGPVGGDPANNVENVESKALALSTECCPLFESFEDDYTFCVELGETFFLIDFLPCEFICAGTWSVISNTAGTFNSCNNSFTYEQAGEGCFNYNYTPSANDLNALCQPFDINVCLEIDSAPPAPADDVISIVDNGCNPKTPGSIAVNSDCGIHQIEFSVDGGNNWSTTAPIAYDETVPTTISVRCNDTTFSNCYSDVLEFTTTPDTSCPCIEPNTPVIEMENNVCGVDGSGGINIISACDAGSMIEFSLDGGTSWSSNMPMYNLDSPITVVARCSSTDFDNCYSPTISEPVTSAPVQCAADLSISKSSSASTANLGDQVIWTISVTNNGPANAENVMVSDNFPSCLTFVESETTVGAFDLNDLSWSIGNLDNGQTAILEITTNVNGLGVCNNSATLTSDTQDPDTSNNSDDASVEAVGVDLELTKTASESNLYVGLIFDYTIEVCNIDDAANGLTYDASGVVVAENLPSNVTLLGFTASSGDYDSNSALWNIGSIANGACETLVLSVQVISDGVFNNSAEISAANETDIDSTPGNDDGDQSEDDEDNATVTGIAIPGCADAGDNYDEFCAYVLANPTSDIALSDCDGAGANNLTECENGGNPFDPSDDCNEANWTPETLCEYVSANPTSMLAMADCDNGGSSNLEECENGGNPLEPGDDSVTVSGTAFIDENGNGILDDGDTILSGITVNISDENGNVIGSTTTDENGNYTFTVPAYGDYTIQFPTDLDGTDGFTTPDVGDDESIDSDTNGSGQITISVGNSDETGLNAGYVAEVPTCDVSEFTPEEFCEYVLENPTSELALGDCDNAGANNLTECENGGNPFDPSDDCNEANWTPESLCEYVLANPTSMLAMADCDNGGSSNLEECENGGNPLEPGDDSVTVSGTAFIDENGNGILDDGDTILSGITVNISDENGNVIGSTTTDENGNYTFTVPAYGDYTIQFPTDLDGTDGFTTPDVGDDENIDSDTNGSGQITISVGNTDQSGLNAGYTAEIPTCDMDAFTSAEFCEYILANPDSELAMADCDGGGANNLTECQNGGNPFSPSDDCDEDNWTSASLCEYVLANPTSMLAMADCDNGGSSNLEECQNGGDPLNPADDSVVIGDYVFIDTNGNGIQDEGDTPLAGVVVTLLDSNGNVLTTATTNEDGMYAFNVPAYGDYILQFPTDVDGTNGFASQNVGGDDALDSDVDANGQVAVSVGNSNDFSIDAGYIAVVVTDCSNPIELPSEEICTNPMTPVEICVDFGDDGPYTVESYFTLYNCTLTQLPNGCFLYTPLPGMEFIGADYVDFLAVGASGQCVHIIVDVIIGCDPCESPVACDIAICTLPLTETVICFDECGPLDGANAEITNAHSVNDCYVQPTDNGCLSYTPIPGMEDVGFDQVTLTVSDGDYCYNVTIDVEVSYCGINVSPTGNPDSAETQSGDSVTIDVLSNDTDPDGDDLTICEFTQGSNGMVELVDGELVYTPADDFEGTDTFTYTVCDGNGGQDTTTVTVTVTEPDLPPVAVDDSATTEGGTSVTISVLDNDSEPEGESFTITDYTQPANGTVTLVDGEFVYTPNPDFTGTDTFTYTITDEDGLSSTATVTVVVLDCQNQPEDYCTSPIEPIIICPFFCEFEEGYTISIDYQITDLHSLYGCSGTIISDECFHYMPLPGYIGTDEVIVTAENEAGDVAVTTVYITVSADCDNLCEPAGTACDDGNDQTINDVEDGNCNCTGTPVPTIEANDDHIETVDNQSVNIDILSNDNFNCDMPMITVTDHPEVGVVLVAGGGLIYIPELGGTGSFALTYELCCGDDCDEAIVTVTVDAHVPCVHDDGVSLRMPNALTPNGDGINDEVDLDKVFAECKPNSTSFKVFDNLGREVYTQETNNGILPQWRAKTKADTDLPNGTYYYIIEADFDGVSTQKTGFIEIRR